MSLTAGTRLGPYEILAPIGAGGMGEVYKARDTRLDRTVAIKVLPEHLAESPERKARFEREAKAISQLNHPNICTLHDVHLREGYGGQVGDEDGDPDYLVMEYIEGETLADRLKKGRLKLDQALDVGIQIADGLDKAHRAGIVHRDLKPGNIMLTKTGVKILDFGLAKLVDAAPVPDESAGPTRERDLTDEQAIVGTLPYMAPEQLEGRAADARTDVWAFGAVLYEMVTGGRAFSGESHASLITAIMSREPAPLSSAQRPPSPGLEHLIRRCLAKDPEARWQTARDMKLELDWIRDEGGDVVSESRGVGAPTRARSLWWVTAVLAAVLGTIAVLGTRARPREPRVVRFRVDPPPSAPIRTAGDPNVAISPDASSIVYGGGIETARLYLRRLEDPEPVPLPDTERGHSPFFSPDGKWVGFFSDEDRTLRKVFLAGGGSSTLCDVPDYHLGATWGPNGTIVFSSVGSGLALVHASGGSIERLTIPDAADERHEFPAFLPGGKAVLFVQRRGASDADTRIAVLDLESGEARVVVEGGTQAFYASTGHLVYSQGGSLLAAPFDLRRLETTGPPVEVLDGVATTSDGPAVFSFSSDGALVYVSGGVMSARSRARLVWVDRTGEVTALSDAVRGFERPRLSPDGSRLAVSIFGPDGRRDLWLYDLERETLTRFTFDGGDETAAVWTHGGTRIAFASSRAPEQEAIRDDQWNVFSKRADGTGETRRLTDGDVLTAPTSWSDTEGLLAFTVGTNRSLDIGLLRWGSAPESELFLSTEFSEMQGELSPDGRWLAYVSDESGRREVFVQSLAEVGGKWQVSARGGTEPRWSQDGRELFFRDGFEMMVARIDLSGGFAHDKPKVLFEVPMKLDLSTNRNYDVTADGQRIVMVEDAFERDDFEMNVILNWFTELERAFPDG